MHNLLVAGAFLLILFSPCFAAITGRYKEQEAGSTDHRVPATSGEWPPTRYVVTPARSIYRTAVRRTKVAAR